jgi:hypothetical protein
MTREEFFRGLQKELCLSGLGFDPGPLMAFVDGVWAEAEHDPDVPRWAKKFIESRIAAGWPKHGARQTS